MLAVSRLCGSCAAFDAAPAWQGQAAAGRQTDESPQPCWCLQCWIAGFIVSPLPDPPAAVLFMWTTLPAFGAASYVPAIVLERPLFTRYVLDWKVLMWGICRGQNRRGEHSAKTHSSNAPGCVGCVGVGAPPAHVGVLPALALRIICNHTSPPACLRRRERNDGLYRVITYLVAKIIEELGLALLCSIIFCELAFCVGFAVCCSGSSLLASVTFALFVLFRPAFFLRMWSKVCCQPARNTWLQCQSGTAGFAE